MDCRRNKPGHTKSGSTIKRGILAIVMILSTNIIMVSPAFSCACCGQDNSWSIANLKSNSHEGNLSKKILLINGVFGNHDQYIDIENISVKGNKYYFKTQQGTFIFKVNPAFSHRKIDITFITNKKYKLGNVADIYHSFIFSGTLTYPDTLSKRFNVKQFKARLIFQGLGNACVNAKDFSKWLIKPVNAGNDYFQGAGKLGVRK